MKGSLPTNKNAWSLLCQYKEVFNITSSRYKAAVLAVCTHIICGSARSKQQRITPPHDVWEVILTKPTRCTGKL